MFAPIVPFIVQDVRRNIPRKFEAEDLEQIATTALIEAATTFERYARTRMRGAVLDAIKGPTYREAKNTLSIDEFPEFRTAAEEIRDTTVIAMEEVLDAERRASRVRSAVLELPAPQREVIELRATGATVTEITTKVRASRRTVNRLQAGAITELRMKVAA